MKLRMKAAGILLALLVFPVGLRAQQQSTPPEKPGMTHLRVDLVLTEYSGEKKISSLPYTLYVGAGDDNDLFSHRYWQSVRMGVRVPITTGTQGTSSGQVVATQFNYERIGTDIDCGAALQVDGRYRVEGKIDRSSIYAPDEGASDGDRMQMNVMPHQPIIRSFGSGFDLVLRDGETGEGISATDPFNGHVLKVSVTIHVVK